MPTSQMLFPSGMIDKGGVIPPEQLSYFRERLRNRLHELVLGEFARQADTYHLTRKELAERIGRRAEQVVRWLGAPGNWTLDTVSYLLLGMASEPDFAVALLRDKLMNSVTPHEKREQRTGVSLKEISSPPINSQPDPSSGAGESTNPAR